MWVAYSEIPSSGFKHFFAIVSKSGMIEMAKKRNLFFKPVKVNEDINWDKEDFLTSEQVNEFDP